jgi:hypothetical protein
MEAEGSPEQVNQDPYPGETSKMKETKPAHGESSLSLALRNRPMGAQT